MPDITVEELHERQSKGEDIFLLDVREVFEYDIAHIDGELIPLGELKNRLFEIEEYKDKEVVVYCRTGARSADAVNFLKSEGFKSPRNLIGGIHEWARKIDSSIPLY
jgi:rhodanese-related sulfurtransferase